jgi:hypothetical protein
LGDGKAATFEQYLVYRDSPKCRDVYERLGYRPKAVDYIQTQKQGKEERMAAVRGGEGESRGFVAEDRSMAEKLQTGKPLPTKKRRHLQFLHSNTNLL